MCVALQVLRNTAKATRPEVKSPGVHSSPGDTQPKTPLTQHIHAYVAHGEIWGWVPFDNESNQGDE
jgi:hypothetical protein